MLFDLQSRPLVWIPVSWPGLIQPETEGAVAQTVTHSIDVQVEILDRLEIDVWANYTPDPEPTGDAEKDRAAKSAHGIAKFKRVAKDWRRLKGSPPFTDENVAMLLGFGTFAEAFGEAYLAAWRGQSAIREGNSDASPASGRAVGA